MTELRLHGRKIETIFHLLGEKENDLTFALGWALAQSPQFMTRLAKALQLPSGFSDRVTVNLQHHYALHGYTDIEIVDPGNTHLIIEAKLGFTLPGETQLKKYADRLIRSKAEASTRALVILAETDRRGYWLDQHAPREVKYVPVRSLAWTQFKSLAVAAQGSGPYAERHLLREFVRYLGAATAMQDQNSNLVYVVSLSNDTFSGGNVSFIEVVEKHRKYFHPIGGWPAEPPNYLGFRYGGELKSIHHVDSYEIINNFAPHFMGKSAPTDRPYFLYSLGLPIKPAMRVPTNGKGVTIYPSGRKWVFIDLLLTAGSVARAAKLTKQRLEHADQSMPELTKSESNGR